MNRYVKTFLGVFRVVCFISIVVYIVVLTSHFWVGDGMALSDFAVSLLIPFAGVALFIFSFFLEKLLARF